MTRSRRAVIGALGAGAAGTLAGCTGSQGGGDGGDGGGGGYGGGGGGGGTPEPTEAPTPTPTAGETMRDARMAVSHYTVAYGSIPTLVAMNNGYFEDHGINMGEITSFAGGGSTVRGVVTGGLTAGAGAVAAVAKAYMAGAPVHLVGVMANGTTIDYQTLPDSDIESIQDVKGGSIAVTNPGSSTEAATIMCVRNADGITLDDVEIVYGGGLGEAISLLMEGKVDVSINVVPKSTVMLKKGQTRRVWHGRDLAPGMIEHALFMGRPLLKERPELAQGIIGAHLDGLEFCRSDHEGAAAMWANALDIPTDIALEAYRASKPSQLFRIEMGESSVKAMGQTLVTQGVIDQQPPWPEIIDQSALSEDYRVDWVN